MRNDEIFSPLNPASFRYAERLEGHIKARHLRTYEDGLLWVNSVSQKGVEADALTSIGAWRSGEGGDRSAPVFVPWFYMDIDRGDLDTALDDTLHLLERLEFFGCDLAHCHVSFSGRRGFHISLETGQFGSPVFVNSTVAAAVIGKTLDYLSDDVDIDTCTFSPLAVIRITGALHPKTGFRKTTWRADTFADSIPEVKTAMTGDLPFRPYAYGDTRVGELEPAADVLFYAAREYTQSMGYYRKQVERAAKKGGKRFIPNAIKSALKGVKEGERFASIHSGRDKAAFMIAIWAIENGDDPHKVLAALKRWNKKNSPPLPESALSAKINSAINTLHGSGKIQEITYV